MADYKDKFFSDDRAHHYINDYEMRPTDFVVSPYHIIHQYGHYAKYQSELLNPQPIGREWHSIFKVYSTTGANHILSTPLNSGLRLVPMLRKLVKRETIQINRTIDDGQGDSETGEMPIFLPDREGVWENQTCGECFLRPILKMPFKGTWSAGTAIYIYFITTNQFSGTGGIVVPTACNFTLDDHHAGYFLHIPDITQNINYNVLGFSRTNLPNTNHTIEISTGDIDFHATMIFDSATYTFVGFVIYENNGGVLLSSQPSQTHKPPVAAILGDPFRAPYPKKASQAEQLQNNPTRQLTQNTFHNANLFSASGGSRLRISSVAASANTREEFSAFDKIYRFHTPNANPALAPGNGEECIASTLL
ncbi:hypothetical protein BDZ94DRAFT_1301720 [Collybia nuda]|uniref:Uncharacterized protein n=1 Tax=Collybia nuda TaxID=64659 RepID=A0A9P6C9U8_9AGAR|nr:hypothetical protein BDZ94DRAFT_1301720 [Collybia nuda]